MLKISREFIGMMADEGRRGVSPVIATLLLIVIAVAAAVLVYMWTVGYATQMKPTTPETGERLKIEAGKLYVSDNNVVAELYVRNVGGSPTYLKNAYLLTTAQDVMAMTTNINVDGNSAATTPISPGSVGEVEINFDSVSGATAGRTYLVRIVTSLGNEFGVELKLQPTS
jgi:flagellin-like protein